MSRLLHAAARGARISWMNGSWSPVPYYINPDDEHLQYGPISTALREMAEDNSYRGDWEHFLANAAANEFTEYFDSRQGDPDYPLFYLILAEALADEGM